MSEYVDFTDWGGMGLPGDTTPAASDSEFDLSQLDLSSLEAGGGDVSASDIPWDLNTAIAMSDAGGGGGGALDALLAAWKFNVGGAPGVTIEGGDTAMPGLELDTAPTGALTRRVPWASIFAIVSAAVRYMGASGVPAVIQLLVAQLAARGISITPGAILLRFLKRRGRRRGSRGVTGRQLSNARRTFHKIDRMYHLLHRGHYARARAPVYAFHRRRRHK